MLKNRTVLFCTLICLAAAAGVATAAPGVVTFDDLSLGQTFDGSAGVAPGDLHFSEDGIKVYAMPFDNGGSAILGYAMPFDNGSSTILGYAEVVDSFPAPRSFHDQNIMCTNGICLLFEFDGFGPVSSEYLQLGGSVNIQVNDTTPTGGCDLTITHEPLDEGRTWGPPFHFV